ncbi:MAG: class I SAM-dependent methyltransferase [Candidatus Sericytochromatia bacterium]|nr:class I SAM-dependent methyltransferase [Candidatus Sericytochromatia bacterium]
MIKRPSGSTPYEALATAYDISGQSRFSLKMVGYLLELLALHRIRPITIVDLACGTGAAAVSLARRKFTVTGVDGSQAMLDRARCRAQRWHAEVQWLSGDLVHLSETHWQSPDPQFDLAMCVYDSLNHLTDPSDFQGAVLAVSSLLKPGGHFFFDVNTPYAYEKAWGETQDTYVGAHHARYWRSRFDSETRLATLDTTYFVQNGSDANTWQRIDTRQHARGYDDQAVSDALQKAGFLTLVSYEALTFAPLTPHTYRAAYLVQKSE